MQIWLRCALWWSRLGLHAVSRSWGASLCQGRNCVRRTAMKGMRVKLLWLNGMSPEHALSSRLQIPSQAEEAGTA